MERTISFLLWFANFFQLKSLKLLVYKFVLYMNIFGIELGELRLQIMQALGPHLEPTVYLFNLMLFLYLLYRFLDFLQNRESYFPNDLRTYGNANH